MLHNRMVAVCDVLGYSNLVSDHSLKEIIDYHIVNIQNIVKSSVHDNQLSQQPLSTADLIKTGAVGHITFSDTVIIYSLTDCRDGYKNVLDAVYRLISQPMFTPHYRFRVGIAYGEMYVDQVNGIYVGKALVEAHDLEVAQEWSGAAMTDTAASMFKNCEPEKWLIVDYDAPIKGNTTKRMSVVNWTTARHEFISEKQNWMQRVENGNEVTVYSNSVAEQKLLNTERFHSDTCVQCKCLS